MKKTSSATAHAPVRMAGLLSVATDLPPNLSDTSLSLSDISLSLSEALSRSMHFWKDLSENMATGRPFKFKVRVRVRVRVI